MREAVNNMGISVIIPVYNVALYLDECLRSLVNQTYSKLEIILVDDGSTDGSGELCDTWRGKDSRITVIHKENGGVSTARNVGLRACREDLISFVDADDWIESDMLEKLANAIDVNNADASMCGFFDYPHGKPEKKGIFPCAPCGFSEAVYQIMRKNGYFTSLWAKLFRRELVFRDGTPIAFDPALSFGEDEVWLLETLRDCKRVSFIPESLYYWRAREGSITRYSTVTEKQISILKAKRKSISLLPKEDKSLLRLAKGRAFNDSFWLKTLAYCTGNQKACHTVGKELKQYKIDFLFSNDIILMRKLKLLVLEIEMLFRFSAKLVQKTEMQTHR